MNRFGILALFTLGSPIVGFVGFAVLLLKTGWLKKTRASRKRMQAQITSYKISQGKFTGRRLREWITVGEYDIFVHRLTEQTITGTSKNERVIYAEVEYRNRSGRESLSCRVNQWHLYGDDGCSYKTEYKFMASYLYREKRYFGSDLFINPGRNARGWLAFPVPEDARIVVLRFMTQFIGTRTVEIGVEDGIEKEASLPKPAEIDERDVQPLEEMARIALDILSLPGRGFKESYRCARPGKLIYDSEWCRLSLTWDGRDYMVGNSISIRYGRLHAPDDEAIMNWNDEICRCWHSLDYALHFLDGRTPAEAVQMKHSHPLTHPFYEEGYRQQYERLQPEWLAQMHLTIWQQYGSRLFALFDLRNPQLWQQYREFLKEVYDIQGRSPAIDPPLDIVC